jgi:hypothetical protein
MIDLPEKPLMAYLAGLFDGEGSIYFAHIKRETERCKSPRFAPILGVAMTTKEGLKEFLEVFHVGHFSFSEKTSMDKDYWRWLVTNKKDIKMVLTYLLPFLKVKVNQAKIMIEFCNLPNRKVGRKKNGTFRKVYSESYFNWIKDKFVVPLRNMNKKGKRGVVFNGEI